MSDIETPAPAVESRPGLLDDPVVKKLIVASIIVVALWLSTVLSALVMGILSPAAPRTYAERELAVLTDAIEKTPKDGKLWARHIDVLTIAKQYSQAEAQVRAALSSAKTDRALILLADARLSDARGDKNEAIKKAGLTIKEADKEIKATLEDYKKRNVTLKDPKVDSPAKEGALILMGSAYSDLGKWQDAVEAYTKYLEIKPTGADVYAERANAYAELGDKKKAEADYRMALTYIPDLKSARDGLKAIGVEN